MAFLRDGDDIRLFAVCDKYTIKQEAPKEEAPKEAGQASEEEGPGFFSKAYLASLWQDFQGWRQQRSAQAYEPAKENAPYELIEIDKDVTMALLTNGSLQDFLETHPDLKQEELELTCEVSGELEERLAKAFEQQNG